MSAEEPLHVPTDCFGVVVRGALGVGKTTVAEALCAKIGGRRVSIDDILERHRLEEWEGGYISERSFLRANDFALREAETLFRRGTPAVFDGNFYHRIAISDLCRRASRPVWVYTLTASLEECISRDRGRPTSYGVEAVRAVFERTAQFSSGVPVDAERPVHTQVADIVRDLRSRGAGIPPRRSARNA